MIDVSKCETCPAVFEYDRITSRRRFCDACIVQRRLKWSKWSNVRPSAAPKRKLIPYAGFDPSERHSF
jgi:hypothetical protein